MLDDAPRLASGAGHDAGVLAEAGVATAMLFVRNPTGISHSPAEFAERDDCLRGVEALTAVVTDLVRGPDHMTTLFASHALLPSGPARDVLIEVDGGRFTSVTPDAAPPGPDATRLRGVVLPGFANAHSHAFHRALRGRTHAGGGTFWTWREAMYSLASRLDPDNYLALARAVYAEMALAGITTVGEFHYVHHAPGGRPYSDPNAMGHALQQAAQPTPASGSPCSTPATWRADSTPQATSRWTSSSSASATRPSKRGRLVSPISRPGPARSSARPSIRSGPSPRVTSPRPPRRAQAARCTFTCPSSRPRTAPRRRTTAAPPPRCSTRAARSRRAPRPCTRRISPSATSGSSAMRG